MERPDYGQEVIMDPSEETRLHSTREYLGKAKQAYVEVGGIYTLSKSEEKAFDFESNIDFICKITLILVDSSVVIKAMW